MFRILITFALCTFASVFAQAAQPVDSATSYRIYVQDGGRFLASFTLKMQAGRTVSVPFRLEQELTYVRSSSTDAKTGNVSLTPDTVTTGITGDLIATSNTVHAMFQVSSLNGIKVIGEGPSAVSAPEIAARACEGDVDVAKSGEQSVGCGSITVRIERL